MDPTPKINTIITAHMTTGILRTKVITNRTEKRTVQYGIIASVIINANINEKNAEINVLTTANATVNKAGSKKALALSNAGGINSVAMKDKKAGATVKIAIASNRK